MIMFSSFKRISMFLGSMNFIKMGKASDGYF